MKKDEIKNYLPAVFQRTIHAGNPLTAFLEVMEMLHQPTEMVLNNIDLFFDARRTSAEFLPFLAQWVNLNRIFKTVGTNDLNSPLMPEINALRELIANAAYFSRWRGTKKGLLLFLQTATDTQGFEIQEKVPDENGQTRPFHIKIRVPQTVEPKRDLIRCIIESEKPVYLTYEIEFYQLSKGGK